MFLNQTLASRCTSLIITSDILNPALAYLPCPEALHVKCKFLPEDLGIFAEYRRLAGTVVEDTMEKAEALRTEILERFSADDDLDLDPLDNWDGTGHLVWE